MSIRNRTSEKRAGVGRAKIIIWEQRLITFCCPVPLICNLFIKLLVYTIKILAVSSWCVPQIPLPRFTKLSGILGAGAEAGTFYPYPGKEKVLMEPMVAYKFYQLEVNKTVPGSLFFLHPIYPCFSFLMQAVPISIWRQGQALIVIFPRQQRIMQGFINQTNI